MKILIVDDEPPARLRLHGMIDDLAIGQVIGEASNGTQALELTNQLHPDIVLLDIRMPGMDGLEAATHLGQLDNPPAIIFTTAYDEYALEAFKTHAVDYLLKPIRKEHLQQALQATTRLTQAQLQAIYQVNEQTSQQPTHISARVKGNIQLIPVDDIYYFQAEHKYVTVRYKEGEVLIEDSLKSIEKKFDQLFLRVHRNALVATRYISALEKDNDKHFYLRLKGCDSLVEISRRHLPDVRKYMKQH